MAYKKYIKKNGRIYGPYLYHSRRVDDKVISEYYGHQNKRDYKKIILSISFILLVFIAIYGFIYLRPYFSGKAIFNLDATYQEGESLDGILKLSLKQGEMIPSSANLLFNNNGKIVEYPLNELVLGEEKVKGDFYTRGKNISGKGEGYGLMGEKIVYPVVYVSFNIYSTNSSETNTVTGELEEETSIEVPIATPVENSSTEIPIETTTETSSEIETPLPEAIIEIPIENTIETPTPETSTETSIEVKKEKPKEIATSTPEISASTNEDKNEKEEKKDSKDLSGKKENKKSSENTPGETTSASTEESSPSITGGIISTLFRGVSNFFLGLTGTGKVSLDIEKTIEANVSYGNSFVHALKEGETVELKKGSAYIIDSNGKERKIDDSHISFDVLSERIIVDTDYSELESGFGEEYLGNEEKVIYLNLSALNLIFEKGSLSIDLVYGGQEIVSLVTSLEQGEIVTNETLVEVPILNETIFLNQTNQTLEEAMEFISSEELSEEEKAELSFYFGNFSIETTKSEIFNGRLVRNYNLGDYEVEYSYEYNGQITPELEEQMQRDLMKWLRDLLIEFSKKKASSESIDVLLGNFSLEGNGGGDEVIIEDSAIEEVIANNALEGVVAENFSEERIENNLTEEILENSTI